MLRILEGSEATTLGTQSATTAIAESSNSDNDSKEAAVPSVPTKFKSDLEVLEATYPGAFSEEGPNEIVITLQDALKLIPRNRPRADAYKGLQGWLKEALGVVLTIKSRKNK